MLQVLSVKGAVILACSTSLTAALAACNTSAALTGMIAIRTSYPTRYVCMQPVAAHAPRIPALTPADPASCPFFPPFFPFLAKSNSRQKNAKKKQVPPTMRFVMDGEMPEYLLAKDLILQVGVRV